MTSSLGSTLKPGESITVTSSNQPGESVTVSAPEDDSHPGGLHPRGRSLWAALGQSLDTPAGQLALEACRTADRLDELDSVIAGKGVLNLLQFRTRDRSWWDSDGDEHVHIEVGFQSVLAEARQQQMAFKALLTELGLDVVKAGPEKKGTALDELAKRRTGRAPGPASARRAAKPSD
ncbi:MAG TPA: hypothetical protein VF642_12335 [Propionibacteriaceae bacterium]